MSNAIIFYEDKTNQIQQRPPEEINGKVKMNFFNLVNNPINIPMDVESTDSLSKPKRGRPKKDATSQTKRLSDGSEIILANEDLPAYQSNVPYGESYQDTNNMLKSAIIQTDMMSNDIAKDLSDIRLSKTLRKKYDYVSLLAGTSSTLLSTKVSAIRELNKTITDCHNLELKRYKDLKLSANEQDDDKRMMDMYNAFISTPVGGGGMSPVAGNFIPQSSELTLGGMPNIVRANLDNSDAGYLNYVNTLSPEQNLMRYEGNPNVKTVVIYDQSTGRRWFDVINILTGESVPNVSRPDQMFLEDTTIDLRNKIARNTNLDTTYPLIVQGNAAAYEY